MNEKQMIIDLFDLVQKLTPDEQRRLLWMGEGILFAHGAGDGRKG